MKIPGPDHPIAIRRHPGRIRVTAAGAVVAESDNALRLEEAAYPPVFYLPRGDVRMDLMVRTDHATHCPYKGDAGYFSVAAGGVVAENAAWTYEDPFPAVAEIAGHLAFYPDRVDAIDEL